MNADKLIICGHIKIKIALSKQNSFNILLNLQLWFGWKIHMCFPILRVYLSWWMRCCFDCNQIIRFQFSPIPFIFLFLFLSFLASSSFMDIDFNLPNMQHYFGMLLLLLLLLFHVISWFFCFSLTFLFLVSQNVSFNFTVENTENRLYWFIFFFLFFFFLSFNSFHSFLVCVFFFSSSI